MDVGIVEAALANIADQVAGIVGTLAPIGTTLTGSFLILSILFLGLNLMLGGSFTSAIVRTMGAAAATFWAIQEWSELIDSTKNASRDIIGLFIGGYGGPSDLFAAASSVASRIMAEPAGWSWSLSGTIGAMAMQVLIPIVAIFTALGLAMPGIMAILAELALLLGAAAAPLILPALVFPLTAPLGWGAINFVVAASFRVVIMGLLSVVFANAVTAVIDKPRPDEVMTFAAMFGLLFTALLAVIAAFSANSIAGQLVGGGIGAIGWASVRGPFQLVGAAAQTAAAVTTGGIAAAALAARGGVAAGRAATGAMSGSSNVTRSSGSGNAFGG
jgi:hypothetical protein